MSSNFADIYGSFVGTRLIKRGTKLVCLVHLLIGSKRQILGSETNESHACYCMGV